MATVVTGDSRPIKVTLKIDGAPAVISGTVKAMFVSADYLMALSEEIAVTGSEPGSDWANGVVVVVPSKAQTAVLTIGEALFSVQVDDGTYQTTWHNAVTVIRGHIT